MVNDVIWIRNHVTTHIWNPSNQNLSIEKIVQKVMQQITPLSYYSSWVIVAKVNLIFFLSFKTALVQTEYTCVLNVFVGAWKLPCTKYGMLFLKFDINWNLLRNHFATVINQTIDRSWCWVTRYTWKMHHPCSYDEWTIFYFIFG